MTEDGHDKMPMPEMSAEETAEALRVNREVVEEVLRWIGRLEAQPRWLRMALCRHDCLPGAGRGPHAQDDSGGEGELPGARRGDTSSRPGPIQAGASGRHGAYRGGTSGVTPQRGGPPRKLICT